MKKSIYKLSELCDIKSGKRIPKDMEYVEYLTPHPYIRARDIKGGKINTDDLIYIEDKVFQKIKKYIINKGDIAITIVGASVGDVGYAKDNVDGYNLTENAVRLTNFKSFVNGKFLFYILAQKQYHDYMQLVAGAAAQPKLGIYKVERIKVELPDVKTQKKIASVLSAYDELIENNNKRIKVLEHMAENLYKEWFVRFRFPNYENTEFENGIPKGWEYKTANELFNITIGKTPDRKVFNYFSEEENDNQKWVSISDIGNCNVFINNTKEYLTPEAVQKTNMIIVPKGTILLSFKLTVGKVAITNCKMCTNEAIAHFYISNDNLREYIYLYLCNFEYSRLGNTSSIGTAVNSKIIKNMKILVPSEDLLEKFHYVVEPIFFQIRLYSENNANLTKQRDLLLPRLMSGKLEV